MTSEDKAGLTKRQVRLTERAEEAVAQARRRVKAVEDDLASARSALRDAEAGLHRINELGDFL